MKTYKNLECVVTNWIVRRSRYHSIRKVNSLKIVDTKIPQKKVSKYRIQGKKMQKYPYGGLTANLLAFRCGKVMVPSYMVKLIILMGMEWWGFKLAKLIPGFMFWSICEIGFWLGVDCMGYDHCSKIISLKLDSMGDTPLVGLGLCLFSIKE